MPRNLTRKDRQQQIGSITKTTINYRIGEWARNIVANEYTIRKSKGVNFLFQKLKGVPAILVGAGPSLDKNIDLLKDSYDKACIITCSSALKAMLKKDIFPHIVFVSDSKQCMRGMIEEAGAYDKSANMILVCDSFVHPSVYEDWKGELFFYNIIPIEALPLTRALHEFTGQIGTLSAGGSVTTIMLAFAKGGLFCDPIVLVGMDCSFYDAKKHHSSNIPSAVDDPTTKLRLIETEDNLGKPCFTTKSFLSFCYWFEDIFTSSEEGTFINATEGGIITNGCSIATLKNTLRDTLQDNYNIIDLLLGDPIVESAKPENRWVFSDNKEAFIKRETYFPGDLLDFIISRMDYKDIFDNLEKHKGLSEALTASFIPEQLSMIARNIADEKGLQGPIINLDETDISSLHLNLTPVLSAMESFAKCDAIKSSIFLEHCRRALLDEGILILFSKEHKLFKPLDCFFDEVVITGLSQVPDIEFKLEDSGNNNEKTLMVRSSTTQIIPGGTDYFVCIASKPKKL